MSLFWTFFFALLAAGAIAHEATSIAIAQVTQEIATRPSDAALYIRRARLELEHADWQAALIDVERADRCATSDLNLDHERAKALLVGQRYPQALATLKTHLEVHPTDAAARLDMARALAAMGNAAQAATNYLAGFHALPHPEPDHFMECARLLRSAKRERDALAVLDTSAVPALAECAIEIEISLGQFDSALARMSRLIAAAQTPEPLLAKRAALLALAGQTSASVTQWTELQQRIQRLPPNARASNAMGRLVTQAQQALASLKNDSQ